MRPRLALAALALAFLPGVERAQAADGFDLVVLGALGGIEDGNRLAEEGVWDDGGGTLEDWLASGSFVFWWSRDLWVGRDGRVFAT